MNFLPVFDMTWLESGGSSMGQDPEFQWNNSDVIICNNNVNHFDSMYVEIIWF